MVATSLNQTINLDDFIVGVESQKVTWEIKNPADPVVSVDYEKGQIVTLRKGVA